MEDVGVNGEDVASVTLRLQPGMTISGKLVFESSTLTPPADLSRVNGGLRSMPTGGSPGDYTPVKVADDGTFSATGVTPGQYGLRFPIVPGMLLNPNKPGAGWVLKSMTWNGRDVADLPLEVTPNRDVTGVVATFTDRPTEFSGTLRDRADRIAPGYPIVVFSTDRRYWTRGSRRVQQIRPASDGTFTLLGLPAGEYYVCAVTDLDPNALTDMPFLDGLAAVAVKVTLADGEKQTQNLKLAGGG